MRLAACIVAFSLIGCAGNPADESGPVARCETTDCFYQRDVRSFEVIDRSTVVVYVGQQRCPFVVELDGLSCDVSFSPEIHFLQSAPGRIDRVTSVREPQVCGTTRGLYAYTGIMDPSVLASARGGVDPITGRRTRPGDIGRTTMPGSLGDNEIDIDPSSFDMCRVRQIRSVNDDQLVELYANEGVMPPPPPIGHGELEVPESVDQVDPPEGAVEEAAAPSGDGAGAAQGSTVPPGEGADAQQREGEGGSNEVGE